MPRPRVARVERNLTLSAATAAVAAGRASSRVGGGRDNRSSSSSSLRFFGGATETRLVGPKMHKTGSTTFGGILARFAMRHGVSCKLYGPVTIPPGGKMARWEVKRAQKLQSEGSAESIVFQHVQGFAWLGTASEEKMGPFAEGREPYAWPQLYAYYEQRVPGALFVLTVRDPLARYVSMSNYFHATGFGCDRRGDAAADCWAAQLETAVYKALNPGTNARKRTVGGNYLATALGLRSSADLDSFLASREFARSLLVVSEQMEASLVVLSARLNWRLEEMVYVPVFDSCVDRENSLALHKIFCTADLTDALERRPRLKQTLVDMHHLDYRLHHETVTALGRAFEAGGAEFASDLARLKRANADLSAHCLPSRKGLSSAGFTPDLTDAALRDDPCLPYLMSDKVYDQFSKVPGRPMYHVHPLPPVP